MWKVGISQAYGSAPQLEVPLTIVGNLAHRCLYFLALKRESKS